MSEIKQSREEIIEEKVKELGLHHRMRAAEIERSCILRRISDLESTISTSKNVLNKMESVEDKSMVISIFEEEFINKNGNEVGKLREALGVVEEKVKETRQKEQLFKIEVFAKEHNLEFGENKKGLIEKIFQREGYCPCKHEKKWKNICPCKDVLKEIMRKGKCACSLFALPETTKNKIEPVKHLEVKMRDAVILANIIQDKETKKMLEAGKVTLLDFYAEWCSPCKNLGKTLEKIKGDSITVKRIDVDKDKGLSDRLGIDAVPFVAVFDKNSKPFTAFSGYRDEEYLKEVVGKAKV